MLLLKQKVRLVEEEDVENLEEKAKRKEKAEGKENHAKNHAENQKEDAEKVKKEEDNYIKI